MYLWTFILFKITEGDEEYEMKIKKMNEDFSICKVEDYSQVDLNSKYCFIGKTDEENSLVCLTENVPGNVTERDDGWKAFHVQGNLDFLWWEYCRI